MYFVKYLQVALLIVPLLRLNPENDHVLGSVTLPIRNGAPKLDCKLRILAERWPEAVSYTFRVPYVCLDVYNYISSRDLSLPILMFA